MKQFKKYLILLICSLFLVGCKGNDFYYSIDDRDKVIDASEYMVNTTTSLENIFADAHHDKATSIEFFDINLNKVIATNLEGDSFEFNEIISNEKASLFIFFSPYCYACDHVNYKEMVDLVSKDYNLLFITEYNTIEEREYLKDRGVDLKYGYTLELTKDNRTLKDLPFPSMLFINSQGYVKIVLEGYVNPEGAIAYMSFLE